MIALLPMLWMVSATAACCETGASLPCWTMVPIAIPMTASQAAYSTTKGPIARRLIRAAVPGMSRTSR